MRERPVTCEDVPFLGRRMEWRAEGGAGGERWCGRGAAPGGGKVAARDVLRAAVGEGSVLGAVPEAADGQVLAVGAGCGELSGERAAHALLVLGAAAQLGEDVDDDRTGGALEAQTGVQGDDLGGVVLGDDLEPVPLGNLQTSMSYCRTASAAARMFSGLRPRIMPMRPKGMVDLRVSVTAGQGFRGSQVPCSAMRRTPVRPASSKARSMSARPSVKWVQPL